MLVLVSFAVSRGCDYDCTLGSNCWSPLQVSLSWVIMFYYFESTPFSSNFALLQLCIYVLLGGPFLRNIPFGQVPTNDHFHDNKVHSNFQCEIVP